MFRKEDEIKKEDTVQFKKGPRKDQKTIEEVVNQAKASAEKVVNDEYGKIDQRIQNRLNPTWKKKIWGYLGVAAIVFSARTWVWPAGISESRHEAALKANTEEAEKFIKVAHDQRDQAIMNSRRPPEEWYNAPQVRINDGKREFIAPVLYMDSTANHRLKRTFEKSDAMPLTADFPREWLDYGNNDHATGHVVIIPSEIEPLENFEKVKSAVREIREDYEGKPKRISYIFAIEGSDMVVRRDIDMDNQKTKVSSESNVTKEGDMEEVCRIDL